MNSRQFERLTKRYVLPGLAGFAAHRSLIFRMPVGDLLAGFSLETVQHVRDDFVAWVFVQPLYWPADGLSVAFGHIMRADGRDLRWSVARDAPTTAMQELGAAIQRVGLPIVERFSKSRDFLEHATMLRPGESKDPHLRHAMALSAFRAEEWQTGIALLTETDSYITELPYSTDWLRRLQERIRSDRELATRSPQVMREQLEQERKRMLALLQLPTSLVVTA